MAPAEKECEGSQRGSRAAASLSQERPCRAAPTTPDQRRPPLTATSQVVCHVISCGRPDCRLCHLDDEGCRRVYLERLTSAKLNELVPHLEDERPSDYVHRTMCLFRISASCGCCRVGRRPADPRQSRRSPPAGQPIHVGVHARRRRLPVAAGAPSADTNSDYNRQSKQDTAGRRRTCRGVAGTTGRYDNQNGEDGEGADFGPCVPLLGG
jgi:hypothetical protein